MFNQIEVSESRYVLILKNKIIALKQEKGIQSQPPQSWTDNTENNSNCGEVDAAYSP